MSAGDELTGNPSKGYLCLQEINLQTIPAKAIYVCRTIPAKAIYVCRR
jgi:hypothetical protein